MKRTLMTMGLVIGLVFQGYGSFPCFPPDADMDRLPDFLGRALRDGRGKRAAVGALRWMHGRPWFSWNGRAHRQYRVLMSTNLVEWFEAPSGPGPHQRGRRLGPSNGPMQYEARQTPDAGCVFYRVVIDTE